MWGYVCTNILLATEEYQYEFELRIYQSKILILCMRYPMINV